MDVADFIRIHAWKVHLRLADSTFLRGPNPAGLATTTSPRLDSNLVRLAANPGKAPACF
jgi:hypothetical protein